MRGRKPTPDKLKVLKGTDRPDRMNPDMPEATSELLQFIPDELTEEARPYWSHVRTKLVKSGIVNNLDREALILLCETWATYLSATEKVRSLGIVVKGKDDYPVRSPYLPIANQASDRLTKLLAEFGMTPSARQRLTVGGAQAPQGKPGDFSDV